MKLVSFCPVCVCSIWSKNKYFISKKSNKVLDKSSRLLKSEIPSQDKKTYAIEVFEKVAEIQKLFFGF